MTAAAPLFGDPLPSLAEYCNDRWENLESEGAPPTVRYRAEKMAADIPLYLLSAVALRCMLDDCRRRFRAAGKKSIPAGDQQEYRHATQMTLPDIQAFILANHDRRLADAKSERDFVRTWCESHPQHTETSVYGSVGLKPPADGAAAT